MHHPAHLLVQRLLALHCRLQVLEAHDGPLREIRRVRVKGERWFVLGCVDEDFVCVVSEGGLLTAANAGQQRQQRSLSYELGPFSVALT